MKKNLSITLCGLLITIMLTNLTQMPEWLGNSGIKLLSYAPWILMAVYSLAGLKYNNTFHVGNQLYLYVLTWIVFLVCAILELYLGKGFNVAVFRPLLISLFIYVISLNLGYNISEKSLNYILVAYILSSLFVAGSIFVTLMGTGFDWSSRVYAYDSKNSASQILLTALFFLIYLHGKKNKLIDIFILVGCAFLTYTMFMMKSRASLLGIVVIFVSVLANGKYGKSTKAIVYIATVAFLGLFILNGDFQEFFLDSFVFTGKDASDLNDVSSGRITMIEDFPKMFAQRPILGHGRNYVECMQLNALIEVGLLGGIPINILALAPIVDAFKSYRKYKKPIDYLLLIVGICYYINGVFEQLSPFGPGVKCYMLWLLFGLSVSWREKYNYEKGVMDYQHADNVSRSLF